jgi:hypothetical protein
MSSFKEFWPFYLSQHLNPTCRKLHFVGAIFGLILAGAAIYFSEWALLVGALFVGYSFSWIGHWAFEKNRPATFRYPIFSFLGDWKMFSFFLSGRLDGELKRYGFTSGGPNYQK